LSPVTAPVFNRPLSWLTRRPWFPRRLRLPSNRRRLLPTMRVSLHDVDVHADKGTAPRDLKYL
jgi:hypothetical protein